MSHWFVLKVSDDGNQVNVKANAGFTNHDSRVRAKCVFKQS